jgi:hypothetical protein
LLTSFNRNRHFSGSGLTLLASNEQKHAPRTPATISTIPAILTVFILPSSTKETLGLHATLLSEK